MKRCTIRLPALHFGAPRLISVRRPFASRESPVPGSLVVPLLLAILATTLPVRGSGQIISPGRLSTPHAELEGLRSCTSCHQLGTPGIQASRCLSCHQPLEERIRAGEGFHATVSDECASCHTEHFGRDFELVRFDTLSFRHDTVGYALDGAHAELSCSFCHTPSLIQDPEVLAFRSEHGGPDRTYLGLPTECVTCHASEDPHGSQFEGRACTACHDTNTWDEAPSFDHDETRYPLTGRHESVACASCHQEAPEGGMRFAPLEFGTCVTCHRDPHAGAMDGSCRTCHTTAGWTEVDPTRVEGRFDHASTGFRLEGVHARASCASCHDPGAARVPELRLTYVETLRHQAFPAPVAEECMSCHVDVHEGALSDAPGGPACVTCHGQVAWLPADFGIERHNLETSFLLEGAHLTVSCESCHRTEEGLDLEPAAESCVTCHADDDPHAGQFEDRSCTDCHTVTSFSIRDFDHSETRFPLEGGHEEVECAACHATAPAPTGETFIVYTPLETRCTFCHGDAP